MSAAYAMLNQQNRLRKHADYQRAYQSSRKQFSKQMSFFVSLRSPLGPNGQPLHGTDQETPRVGLTVGKVLGKAHERNRIKRRLRALVRRHLGLLSGPLDIILHPRRAVLDLDHATLDREVAQVFRTVQKLAAKQESKR